jgi:predicted O-linked N-acetylglucosamine transferase (SPINDLY family)
MRLSAGEWIPGAECTRELQLWKRERIPVSVHAIALARGTAHQEAGEFEQAEKVYEQILRGDPQHAAAWHQLGMLSLHQGDLERAAECISRAVSLEGSEPVFHIDLGRACALLNRVDEAVESFQQAILLDPDNPQAHHQMGAALQRRGDMIGARLRFQQAVRLAPNFAAAWNDLGSACQACAELDQAGEAFEQVLRLTPGLGGAHFNLGNVRLAQGRLLEAVACYARVLERQPPFAEALNNLGTALHRLGRPEQALHAYELAQRLSPDFVGAGNELGALLDLLPAIYESTGELHRCRARFEKQLAALEKDRFQLDPAREPVPVNSLLAYQGLNDRELARRIAGLCRSNVVASGSESPAVDTMPRPHFAVEQIAPGTSAVRETGFPTTRNFTGKIRIGFLSRFLCDHAIGDLTKGLISKLSRANFEVEVFLLGDTCDETTSFLNSSADRFINLPGEVSTARAQVAAAGLDVLVYPDVGLDSVATALAHLRLARVQCAVWGHPVTTGIPTIDHFLSSKLCEPADAAEHYTENLVLFESLPVYYERPANLGALSRYAARLEFGLPQHAHLYLCPQPLFMLHPEFDGLLRAILDRDAAARIVLIEAPHRLWNEKLSARLRHSLGALADRVIFTGRVDRQAFLRLIGTADVLLDPLYFGGGNTSYQALGLGMPIVTLPAPYLRGRLTAGCYRKMKFENFVARSPDEYVDLAVRLGTDSAYNAAVRAEIASRSDALYVDIAAVRELERFFQQVARPGNLDTARAVQPVAA